MSNITNISHTILCVSWIIVFWKLSLAEASKCPGECISQQKCKEKGGKILAYCTNSKACCEDPKQKIGDCNDHKWNSKVANFKSPKYPESTGGNMVCQFHMNLYHSTVGIKIDFLDLYLPIRPGSEILTLKSTMQCDSDMFFIKGFSNWMPDPRCGNLTGHSIVLESDEDQQYVSLVFVMSSMEYKWNVKLTQISKEDLQRKEKCLNAKMEMWNNQIGVEYEYRINRNITNTTDFDPGLITLTSFDDYNSEASFIGPMPLIVQGEVSKAGLIPWQISIQKKVSEQEREILLARNLTYRAKYLKCPYFTSDYRHNCGGSIIGERHILTAAHCISSKNLFPDITAADILKIHVGDFDFCLSNETSNFAEHTVEKITLHYNYNVGQIGNDIAVIKLKEKIKFGKTVRPIPLASLKNDGLEYENSTRFLLSGWGNVRNINLTQQDKVKQPKPAYPTKMRKTTKITVNDLDYCNVGKYYEYAGIPANGTAEEAEALLSKKYQGSFSKWVCTSGSSDGTPSYGDSGGPLAAFDENWKNPQLIGVVSHLEAFYTIENKKLKVVDVNYFAKVSSYLDWVLMAFEEECE